MAYESRTIRRQKLRYNNANTERPIEYQLVLEGAKVTPTSATLAVYKPGQTTAVLAATAMTVSGTKMTKAVSTTTVADYPIGTGYRGEIAVTYSSVVYTREIFIDVVRYYLDLNIGIDQLRAFDDGIQGMQHISDEDFSELIESCRDSLQAKIEAKVIGDKKLVENMILDATRVAVAAKYYILGRVWFNKGDFDRFNIYRDEFKDLWEGVLNSIQYDKDQDGQEDAAIGGITYSRLVT